MAQSTEDVKRDIEETRERMGETLDALSYKADVPTRTKEWIGDKKDALVSKVGGATPDGEQVKRRAGRLKRSAESNPIGMAIGGVAVGFIAGLLVPSTRVEDERIGPLADDVKSTAAEAGREALERGKTVVQEAGGTALETAKERAQEESSELTSSLQDKAREVATPDEPASPPTGSASPTRGGESSAAGSGQGGSGTARRSTT